MKKFNFLIALLGSFLIFPTLKAQTTVIKGLTVVVSYADYDFTAGLDTISSMMNQSTGFSAWGNNGSVREYYNHQSNGKVDITSLVIPVTLSKNFDYYHGAGLPYNGGVVFAQDVVAKINSEYPAGFTGLTKRPEDNRIWNFTILSHGPKGIGVAYGVSGVGSIVNDGVPLPVLNVAVINYTTQQPKLNVICHELGHSLFDWTDYYIVNGSQASNLGHYCLMGSGGTDGTPTRLNAGLRYTKGWIDHVVDITDGPTRTYYAVSNHPGQVFKYTNLLNPKEYYLIEAFTHSKYYVGLTGDGYVTDQGLAIWYVDEDGGLNTPSYTPYPKIRLVQSNGLDDMKNPAAGHRKHRGDDDLFNDVRSAFNDSLYSRFQWRNGNQTGLIITDISGPGDTVSFKVNARANTILAFYGDNGKVSPAGYVNAPNGQDKVFHIIPDMGYEIEHLYINDVPVTPDTIYTFANVTSDQRIQALFKKSVSGYELPSPWSEVYIGSGINPGIGAYKNGKFGIESHGSDIYYGDDRFNYIYQPLRDDGEIVARVSEMNEPQGWSKAGIMIRETLTDNSKHMMLVKTPWNGIAPQYRPSTGGGSYHNSGGTSGIDTLHTPRWLKLIRTGNDFKSYYSYDGLTWIYLETTNIPMIQDVYIGLCASGASDGTPVKANFDHVSVLTDTTASLLSHFDVPRLSGLPTINTTYNYAHTIGAGGPDLSNVTQTVINWNLSANGLYQFSFQTNNGIPNWYISIPLYASHFLNTSSPGVTISSSIGIANMEGTYYANMDGSDLVLVEETGAFALYFSNNATPPALRRNMETERFVSEPAVYPNPFLSDITIALPAELSGAELTITDISGVLVEKIQAAGPVVLGEKYASGLYFVYIKHGSYSAVMKIVKSK